MGLVEVGFAAVDDDGRFTLGERLIGLTNADADAIAATFASALRQVAEATGETVDLSVLRGGQMWFIDQIESGHRLRAVSRWACGSVARHGQRQGCARTAGRSKSDRHARSDRPATRHAGSGRN